MTTALQSIGQMLPGLVILAAVALWIARRKPRNESPEMARARQQADRGRWRWSWGIWLGWTLPL